MKRILLVAAGAVLFLPLVSAVAQTTEDLTKEKILASNQQWQDKYDTYEPAAELLDALKTRFGTDMKVDVYLGLWCPDSRNHVPPFIKILDRLGVSVPVRYVGVPRKASRDVKFYVEEMNVEKVPTFIFYREGKEIGRIIENPKATLLEDMVDIVLK